MGKGSRNRAVRITENQEEVASATKLSKRQLIKLQEQKARTKKYITTACVSVLTVALAVVIVVISLGRANPKLEGVISITSEKYELDNAVVAYLMYSNYNEFVANNSYMLSYYGLDTSKSLKTQYLYGSSSSQTWFSYFLSSTLMQLKEFIAVASEAIDKNITLDEEEIADIDEYMNALKKQANSNGLDTKTWLSVNYVSGVTMTAVRTTLELQQLAHKYYQQLMDSYTFTDEEMNKYVLDNPESFFMFDYISYTFTAQYATTATTDEKKAALEEAKKKAEELSDKATSADELRKLIVEMLKEAEAEAAATATATTTTAAASGTGTTEKTDEDYLKNYDKKEQAYVKDDKFTAWAYEEGRAVGDKTVITDDSKYTATLYLLTKTAYKDESVTKDVRHILFTADKYGSTDAAKAKAEEILNQFKAGEMTAEKFGELAKEYTEDSNGDKGGLHENVQEGQMVTAFNDWIYDEDRKVGDVDIVSSSYGYHVMWFEGDGEIVYKVNAEAGLKNEKYADYLKELQEKYPMEYDLDLIKNIP